MSDAFSVFDPVDELVDGFLERYRRGERPSLTECTANTRSSPSEFARFFRHSRSSKNSERKDIENQAANS